MTHTREYSPEYELALEELHRALQDGRYASELLEASGAREAKARVRIAAIEADKKVYAAK